MWTHNGYCVSPNRNLVTYRGYEKGTHTRRKARWLELPIEEINLEVELAVNTIDEKADKYLHQKVFNSTLRGVALGPAERLALRLFR